MWTRRPVPQCEPRGVCHRTHRRLTNGLLWCTIGSHFGRTNTLTMLLWPPVIYSLPLIICTFSRCCYKVLLSLDNPALHGRSKLIDQLIGRLIYGQKQLACLLQLFQPFITYYTFFKHCTSNRIWKRIPVNNVIIFFILPSPLRMFLIGLNGC